MPSLPWGLRVLLLLLLLLLGAPLLAAAAAPRVRLVVSYCPSAFSGEGAVVEVDGASGAFSVVGKFGWGNLTEGCPVDFDPNVDVHGDVAYLDFLDDWGAVAAIDLAAGALQRVVVASAPDLFDGFTSFEVVEQQNRTALVGVTPHVEQDGWCSDGCFAFADMDMASGRVSPRADVPYKAVMTDAHYLDAARGDYWVQASYPLTQSAACTADETQQCWVRLDAASGALKATYAPGANNVTVYKYHKGDASKLVAWVYGFEAVCADPFDDFAFAHVDLTAVPPTTQLIACIPKNTIVHTDPNIAGFTADGAYFAQASGNAETGEVQVLVMDSFTGKVLLNSPLPGLKKALGVSSTTPFINIWGVDVV